MEIKGRVWNWTTRGKWSERLRDGVIADKRADEGLVLKRVMHVQNASDGKCIDTNQDKMPNRLWTSIYDLSWNGVENAQLGKRRRLNSAWIKTNDSFYEGWNRLHFKKRLGLGRGVYSGASKISGQLDAPVSAERRACKIKEIGEGFCSQLVRSVQDIDCQYCWDRQQFHFAFVEVCQRLLVIRWEVCFQSIGKRQLQLDES